ncbi:MAG: flagellar M-ring protein FliF [Roseovarius sp.]|nr:flagellar M-ring protein FliF [Roseovarius sp.]
MQQFLTLWHSLDMRRRMIVGVTTLGVFAAILGLARMAASPSLSLLYAGLEGAAAGEVVAALDQRGIIHEVRGNAIYVASAQRDSLRMVLAGEGLPSSTARGYELLDGLSGFGTTSQMFDAAYWRAKEGELARTIVAHPAITAARVHLASGGSAPFQRNLRQSASVAVTTTGAGLLPRHARALQFLVASAVAGLTPEDVAVIDSEGGLVGAEEVPANAPDERAEALRMRALRLLEARVGRGNAVVEVTLDTVTETESIRERRVDPDSRVAISTDTEESSSNASDQGNGVTVASNLPEGEAGGGAPSTSRSDETRERVNYEVSSTEREILRAPGAIRRMSVAVLVNALPDPGTGAPVPRPDDELEALRALVGSAVGLDSGRGDVLTLRALPFETLMPEGAMAVPGLWERLAIDTMSLVQAIVLAVVALVLGLFVLRPVLMRPPATPSVQLAPPPAFDVAEPAPALTGEIDVGEFDESGMALAFNDNPDARSGLSGAMGFPEDPVERLRALIGERQEETVEILRTWLEGEEERV